MKVTIKPKWPKKIRTPKMVAALTFLIVVIFGLIGLSARQAQVEREIEISTSQVASALATKLEGRLKENLAVGRVLKNYIEVLGELSQEELEVLGPRILENDLNIRHIAIAPDLIVSAIFPLRGNEAALGLNFKENDLQRDAALRAMKEKVTVLAGPMELVQGGKGHIIARFPVFEPDGSPWGIVAVVIRLNDLLKDSGFYQWQDEFYFGLKGSDGKGSQGETFWGDDTIFDAPFQEHTINVPGGEWLFAIKPKYGSGIDHAEFVLLIVVLSITACLVSASAFMYSTRRMEKVRYYSRIKALSTTDTLTQLPSRYHFNERLYEIIKEAERDAYGFAVLFIDLDHFKEVNDSLGHSIGDELLRIVASRLKNAVRPYDLVSRLSGDEFVVVLRKVHSTVEIEERGEALARSLAESAQLGAVNVNVTCSLGVAVYPEDGLTAEILLKHADRAMYESKRSGRNSLHFYNAAMQKEADRYIETASQLRDALEHNKLTVYYQPIYDLKTKRFTRCEALCRWLTDSGKPHLTPDVFIPVAEQSGIILDMGQWITAQVFECMKRLTEQGLPVHFSINRSPQEFNSLHHTQMLLDLCESSGVSPKDFTLEITESLYMSDNIKKVESLDILKGRGFKFSIDDFGTGYSSLSYLREFPVSTLKIDKTFIDELGHSAQTEALVRVIVYMAKALNIDVVAEGVESAEQMIVLEAFGCRFIQGFYLAKPMPESDLVKFLREARIL